MTKNDKNDKNDKKIFPKKMSKKNFTTKSIKNYQKLDNQLRGNRPTDRQTDRPTDRQTDRQTDIVTYRVA